MMIFTEDTMVTVWGGIFQYIFYFNISRLKKQHILLPLYTEGIKMKEPAARGNSCLLYTSGIGKA